jgi:hypothetical protein
VLLLLCLGCRSSCSCRGRSQVGAHVTVATPRRGRPESLLFVSLCFTACQCNPNMLSTKLDWPSLQAPALAGTMAPVWMRPTWSQPHTGLYCRLAHSVGEAIQEAPRTLQPPPGAALREYQMVGLQWMVSLYNNHLNGILADEMVRSAPSGGVHSKHTAGLVPVGGINKCLWNLYISLFSAYRCSICCRGWARRCR